MIRALSLATLATLALGACGSVRPVDERQIVEIENLTRAGDYRAAAELSGDLLERLPENHPLRPRAEQASRDVSLASGMEVVRTLTLADEDDAALELLVELDARYPGSTVVAAWTERTKRKLADRWFEIAREALAGENFDAAREAYRKAIQYEPDHPVAPGGLARLSVLEEYRAGLAEDYYYDGVRGLTDQRLAESENGFEKSRKYDEDARRTQLRLAEVRREEAKARVAYAEQLVADRRYAAARLEYAEAERLDPESEEIAARHELMKTESEVAATISEAESFLLRKEYDRAVELLAEAGERTELQADLVADALSGIDDSRVALAYQKALDLEHDFRFPEAKAAYGAILEERDFYRDVRARIDKCGDIIANSERLYAEAEAATDDAKKLELFRRIELVWPDYRDIPERIEALTDGD